MRQFELNFDAGLVDRYPDWMDCIRASVHGCGRPFKAVAADLDMSASELSRRLSDSGDIHLVAKMLPDLLRATKDFTPIFWLVESFCDDPDQKRRAAIAQIPALVAKLEALVKVAQP